MNMLSVNNTPYISKYKNSVNFKALQVKKIQLSQKELNLIEDIDFLYADVQKFYDWLGKNRQEKLRKFYPKLVTSKDNHGLVFKNTKSFDFPRVNLIKMGDNQRRKNRFMFSWCSEENKRLIDFNLKHDLSMEVVEHSNETENTITRFFKEKNGQNLVNFLKSVHEQLKKVKYIIDNFKDIDKLSKKLNKKNSVTIAINKLKDGQQFGICEINDELLKKTLEIRKKLYLKKDFLKIKTAFSGDVKKRISGFTFKNIGDENNTYIYTPLQGFKFDDKIAKLEIYDTNDKRLSSFIFFKNGKVASPVKLPAVGKVDERENNLRFLFQKELEQLNFSQICNTVKSKLNEFDEFIELYRSQKHRKPRTPKNVEKQKAKKIKANLKETKSEVLKAEKQKKKKEKTEKPKVEKVKLVKEMSSSQKVLTSNTEDEKIQIKHTKPVSLKTKKRAVSVKVVKKPVVKNTEKSVTLESKLLLNITNEISRIKRMFDILPEERPSHLHHRIMHNGKKFPGLITFKTSDNKEIEVVKMRVLKYDNFLYYRVQINDNGKKTIFSLDPIANKFIETDKDGRVVYNDRNQIVHISKEKLVNSTEEIKNFSRYIDEMFAI